MIKTIHCTTIAEELTIEGIGLHSGSATVMTIRPAAAGGIRFVTPAGVINASAGAVIDTSRGTTLGESGAVIMTVEHVMSALAGAGIDCAEIICSSKEVPIMDGSSGELLSLLTKCGRQSVEGFRTIFSAEYPLFVQDGEAFICLLPSDNFGIDYYLNYSHPMIGTRHYSYSGSFEEYRDNIAVCRTFALYEEIQMLLDSNLAKGGCLDNCIVVYSDHFSTPLRHSEELTGHKILDLIGDLSLCGASLKGRVIASRSGHKLNTKFASLLEQRIENEKQGDAV